MDKISETYTNRTGTKQLFPNEKHNAENIIRSFYAEGYGAVALRADMQSGKTSSIMLSAAMHKRIQGGCHKTPYIVHITNLSSNELRDQNKAAAIAEGLTQKNILVQHGMGLTNKRIDHIVAAMIRSPSDTIMIIIDELHYASSEDRATIQRINKIIDGIAVVKPIKMLLVSATPYGLLNRLLTQDSPTIKGLDTKIIHGKQAHNYTGVADYWANNQVIGIDDIRFGKIRLEVIKAIRESSPGLSIIRLPAKPSGLLSLVQGQLELEFANDNCAIIPVGKSLINVPDPVNSKDFLREAESLIAQGIKVIGLTVAAFQMGDDIGLTLKSKGRVIVETLKSNVASCVQGLPGRFAGYHKNPEIKIFAERSLIDSYVEELTSDERYLAKILKVIRFDTTLTVDRQDNFIEEDYKSQQRIITDSNFSDKDADVVESLLQMQGRGRGLFINTTETEKTKGRFCTDTNFNNYKNAVLAARRIGDKASFAGAINVGTWYRGDKLSNYRKAVYVFSPGIGKFSQEKFEDIKLTLNCPQAKTFVALVLEREDEITLCRLFDTHNTTGYTS